MCLPWQPVRKAHPLIFTFQRTAEASHCSLWALALVFTLPKSRALSEMLISWVEKQAEPEIELRDNRNTIVAEWDV